MVEINGKSFKKYISKEKIATRIQELGKALQDEFNDKKPVFIGVLNGAVIFAADLIRASHMDAEMGFVRLRSYDGMASTGEVTQTLDLDIEIEGKDVILLEDIVDTGNTLSVFIPILKSYNPASINVVTLLLKPEAFEHKIEIKHAGFEIPNDFVIGYGLDFAGFGRHLEDIYQLDENAK